MPFYQRIPYIKHEDPARIINGLKTLRVAMNDPVKGVPKREFQDTILLGTWNIRDFDKPQYGPRFEEAIYYIAEIISRFDIVAVQEVYKELDALNRVMKVLGGHWKAVFSDETVGSKGNDERMAFLYDTRKVRFGGLAGELVIPPAKVDGESIPGQQLVRTPFMCGFKAGWTSFILTTVHIEPQASKGRDVEIRNVGEFLRDRAKDESTWARNILILGDFNIGGADEPIVAELEDLGFKIPTKDLTGSPSRSGGAYDQIVIRNRKDSLQLTGRRGVFEFYDHVFKDASEDISYYEGVFKAKGQKSPFKLNSRGLARTMEQKRTYFRRYWRTQQMSDHYPRWVELHIEYSDEYLDYLETKKIPQVRGSG